MKSHMDTATIILAVLCASLAAACAVLWRRAEKSHRHVRHLLREVSVLRSELMDMQGVIKELRKQTDNH